MIKKIGRPTVLDEKKKNIILGLIKSGCGRVSAAHSVNCDPKTIVNTAKRDPAFAEKLALAEKSCELIHLENINQAGKLPQYWRASAWVLERLFPERYGKTNPEAISPSQLADLIAQIARVIAQEIPVAEFRKNVLIRFDNLLRESVFIQQPIPNPSKTIPLETLPSNDAEQKNHGNN